MHCKTMCWVHTIHPLFSLFGFKSRVINRNGFLRGRWMSAWCKLLQPHHCCCRLNLVTPWSWETSHFPKLLLIWSDTADLLQHFSCWRCYKPAFHMHNIHAILPLTDTIISLKTSICTMRKSWSCCFDKHGEIERGLTSWMYVEVHLDRCHLYISTYFIRMENVICVYISHLRKCLNKFSNRCYVNI